MKHLTIIKLLILIYMATLCLPARADNTADKILHINVTIIDEYGDPLPGASVVVRGRSTGTAADAEGHVALVVRPGDTVEFRYVGMKTKTMKVTKDITGRLVLENDHSVLDQVVVTGYQRTTQKRTTGSVAVLSAEDLKGTPTANLDMLMQGKIAGVDVKALSGRPGESAQVRIRGTNTITGNADPLWVVDGVPLQKDIPSISSSQIRAGDFNDIFTNGISGINPNDIESVTVLKDASAAAIYGSRAAGGVIVVTTKRGKEGKISVTYSGNVSLVTKPGRNANLMNSAEKLEFEQELWDEFSARKFANGERYPVIGVVGQIRSGYGKYKGMTPNQQNAEIERLGQTSTDWFDMLFHNSASHSHYLSLSGGSEKINYYVSGGYAYNSGLVKHTDYERYNFNSKIDIKPSRKIKIGVQLDMSMQNSNGPSLNVDPYRYAYFANPYEKPYNEDGSYAADGTYFTMAHANGSYEQNLPAEGYNIIREMNETSNESKSFSATAIATISWNLWDNLTFEGLASYGYTDNRNDNINGTNTYAAWLDRPFEGMASTTSKRRYGSITQSSGYNTNYNLRGHFHYHKEFGGIHYISALAGAEIRGQYSKNIFEKRYGYDPVSGNSSIPVYPENLDVNYSSLLSYAALVDGLSGQSRIKDAFASFYLSLDYVLMNRYVLSLTGRTDGSNNFGSDEQFNPTGSVGLSWNIDQESWMQPLVPWLSSLSLRGAFGYTGNINRSVYPRLVMTYSSLFRKSDDQVYRMGSIGNAPNPHLRWEKTRDTKISIDMGLFNDRLRIQGELYDRRTRDAVSSVPVVYTTGFSSQSFNTSEILNQGAELSISATPLRTKEWHLTIGANIAWNRNKLLKYNPPTVSMFNSTYEGYPIGAVIAGKVQGIDPSLGIYTYEVRPDASMNTAADRNKTQNYAFYLGTANAPTNGGYSISVGWKNLNLSLGGSYSIDAKVLNNITAPSGYSSLSSGVSVVEHPSTQDNDLYVYHFNTTRDHTDRWTSWNPRTDGYPRIIDAYGEYLGLSNYMVTSESITRASMMQDVSYFKLGSIMLSYSLQAKWLKKAYIQNVSFTAGMSNVFTITNYKGIDPETPGAVYPQPRTYSFGLSVTF